MRARSPLVQHEPLKLLVLLADWHDQDLAGLATERVRQSSEELSATGSVQSAAEGAVLDVRQPEVFAGVRDAHTEAVVRDVVDDEGLKLGTPHHLKRNGLYAGPPLKNVAMLRVCIWSTDR